MTDATALPFPDEYFDCVYSFGVLHHIPDVAEVLSEVKRVLKPGGVLQTAVYHRYSVHTANLLVREIESGGVRKLGISDLLSTIENGADGETIKPFVKLYSLRDWRGTVERAAAVSMDPIPAREREMLRGVPAGDGERLR
jgi:ubiquinone/menaquinone biosynthesis C-methylase UbiE